MGNSHRKKESPPPPQPTANPNATISAQDRAILQLKVQKDRLHQYTRAIRLVIARELQVAKDLLAADKKANALLALKRKKYQENLLDQTERQMLNLEELVHSIRFAEMQAQVFDALQQGNRVLAQLNRETSIEEVERLMEDTREAVDYQNQISEMMGGQLNQQDEDDIGRTIAEWEEQEARTTGTTTTTTSTLPAKQPAVEEAPTVEEESPEPIVAPATAASKPVKAKQREVVLA